MRRTVRDVDLSRPAQRDVDPYVAAFAAGDPDAGLGAMSVLLVAAWRRRRELARIRRMFAAPSRAQHETP
jgi:MYXO-CTERM domain-containing protein